MSQSSTGTFAGAYGGHGPLIAGLAWTACAIGTLLVFLRIYAKFTVIPETGASLYWIITAWVLGMLNVTTLTVALSWGMGNHVDSLDPEHSYQAMRFGWITQEVALFAVPFGKISIMAFLLQIHPYQRIGRVFLWFMGITILVLGPVNCFVAAFQCRPFDAIFYVPPHCHLPAWVLHYSFFYGSWAATTDLALAIYPIFMLWNVQIATRLKAGLCILMGLGVFATGCSITKTVFIVRVVAPDPTFDLTPLLVMMSTELWIVIIVGSIPPLWPVFLHLSRNLGFKISTYRGTSRYHPNNNTNISKEDGIPLHARLHNDHARNAGAFEALGSRSHSQDAMQPPRDGIAMTKDVSVLPERVRSLGVDGKFFDDEIALQRV